MTHDEIPLCVAFLAEHKSYTDEWVNFQVLRYQVGYWVREFEALEAAWERLRTEEKRRAAAGEPPRQPPPQRRTTLTPIVVVLVYHGKEAWQNPLRFARHLTGLADPECPLSIVMGRYVPDFEPHFINITDMVDEAIRGEVTTRLLVTVLKYIFSDGLGGHLDEILSMAGEILRQPSGMEMVMALLRYISRSAVRLNRAEITQKLLVYLPKEGGILMETLAQEWIEEGKLIGFDLGKQEGVAAQRQRRSRRMSNRLPGFTT